MREKFRNRTLPCLAAALSAALAGPATIEAQAPNGNAFGWNDYSFKSLASRAGDDGPEFQPSPFGDPTGESEDKQPPGATFSVPADPGPDSHSRSDRGDPAGNGHPPADHRNPRPDNPRYPTPDQPRCPTPDQPHDPTPGKPPLCTPNKPCNPPSKPNYPRPGKPRHDTPYRPPGYQGDEPKPPHVPPRYGKPGNPPGVQWQKPGKPPKTDRPPGGQWNKPGSGGQGGYPGGGHHGPGGENRAEVIITGWEGKFRVSETNFEAPIEFRKSGNQWQVSIRGQSFDLQEVSNNGQVVMLRHAATNSSFTLTENALRFVDGNGDEHFGWGKFQRIG